MHARKRSPAVRVSLPITISMAGSVLNAGGRPKRTGGIATSPQGRPNTGSRLAWHQFGTLGTSPIGRRAITVSARQAHRLSACVDRARWRVATDDPYRISVRWCLYDKHLVPLAPDLHGDGRDTDHARSGEHHTLAGDEDRLAADRRSSFTLC